LQIHKSLSEQELHEEVQSLWASFLELMRIRLVKGKGIIFQVASQIRRTKLLRGPICCTWGVFVAIETDFYSITYCFALWRTHSRFDFSHFLQTRMMAYAIIFQDVQSSAFCCSAKMHTRLADKWKENIDSCCWYAIVMHKSMRTSDQLCNKIRKHATCVLGSISAKLRTTKTKMRDMLPSDSSLKQTLCVYCFHHSLPSPKILCTTKNVKE